MSTSFQVMHAPVISDIHLDASTRAKITDDRNVLGLHRFVYDHGVFVFACGETTLHTHADYEDIPSDLANCFRLAWGEGFEWIRFDADGDVIASLSVFEED